MREEPFSPGGGAMGLDWGGMTAQRKADQKMESAAGKKKKNLYL